MGGSRNCIIAIANFRLNEFIPLSSEISVMSLTEVEGEKVSSETD
jgi:hypothetical protein